MKTLPLGTAYTVWTGIGAVGAFVVGVLVLGEEASVARILAAALIVSGLILMKVSADLGVEPQLRASVIHAAKASGGSATRSAMAMVRSAPAGLP